MGGAILHLPQDHAGLNRATTDRAGGQARLSVCEEGGMLAPVSEPGLSQL